MTAHPQPETGPLRSNGEGWSTFQPIKGFLSFDSDARRRPHAFLASQAARMEEVCPKSDTFSNCKPVGSPRCRVLASTQLGVNKPRCDLDVGGRFPHLHNRNFSERATGPKDTCRLRSPAISVCSRMRCWSGLANAQQ